MGGRQVATVFGQSHIHREGLLLAVPSNVCLQGPGSIHLQEHLLPPPSAHQDLVSHMPAMRGARATTLLTSYVDGITIPQPGRTSISLRSAHDIWINPTAHTHAGAHRACDCQGLLEGTGSSHTYAGSLHVSSMQIPLFGDPFPTCGSTLNILHLYTAFTQLLI